MRRVPFGSGAFPNGGLPIRDEADYGRGRVVLFVQQRSRLESLCYRLTGSLSLMHGSGNEWVLDHAHRTTVHDTDAPGMKKAEPWRCYSKPCARELLGKNSESRQAKTCGPAKGHSQKSACSFQIRLP
jgi:hypothetical protein